MWLNAKKSFAKIDEDGDVENAIWGKMAKGDSIIKK